MSITDVPAAPRRDLDPMRDAVPAREGVVLLHGIARTARSMARLERHVGQAGFATLNLDYPSRRMNLASLADHIEDEVVRFEQGVSRLHFLTHSMGGLLARCYITRHRPRRLGRVVMLGPPNQGSEVADLLGRTRAYRWFYGPAGDELATHRIEALADCLGSVDYECGIIAGDRSVDPFCWFLIPGGNDGKVAVARTRLDGASDHVTLHTSHPTMLLSADVAHQAVAFLATGRFVPPPMGRSPRAWWLRLRREAS